MTIQNLAYLFQPKSVAVIGASNPTQISRTIEEALRAAQEIGYPAGLKIVSPGITHKSDVGGIALKLETPQALQLATKEMRLRMAEHCPNARITGFTIQKMAHRPGGHELIVGVSTDPVFGPVIMTARWPSSPQASTPRNPPKPWVR